MEWNHLFQFFRLSQNRCMSFTIWFGSFHIFISFLDDTNVCNVWRNRQANSLFRQNYKLGTHLYVSLFIQCIVIDFNWIFRDYKSFTCIFLILYGTPLNSFQDFWILRKTSSIPFTSNSKSIPNKRRWA